MKLSLKAGTTSKSVGVFIPDSSSTVGDGLTGLVFNSASLTAYWYQPGVTAPAAITLATLASATAAFSSGGFKELDAVNAKGHYRLDIPNAVLTGATSAVIVLRGATNMQQTQLEIELTAVDNQSATAFITGVNSLAPPANWNLASIDASGRVDVAKIAGTAQTARDIGASVLLSNGTGTGQVKLASGYVAMTWADIAAPTTTQNLSGTTIATTQQVDVNTIKTQTVTCAAGVTVLASVGTAATSTAQTGDNYARIGAAGAGLTALGDTRIANLDAAVSSRMATFTLPTNFADLSISAATGLVNISQTGADKVWGTAARILTAGTNIQLPSNGLANVTAWTVAITGNITGNVSGSVGSVTGNVGGVVAVNSGAITSASFQADAIDNNAVGSSAISEIAAGVWDETLASHLTSGSTGAALNAAGAAGDPWSTALPGAYGAGTAGKIVGDNINAAITSRMATYTQPTGFLAATFPSGTIANTTNITAGTITTTTNLTNAPTSGDFTATMKTSIGTAVAASAVASVTGNVGGNLGGSLTASERNAIADAHIARNIAGGSSTGRIVADVYAFIRNKWTVSGTTLTVYATDDSTTQWSGTVTATAGADPITGNDPS